MAFAPDRTGYEVRSEVRNPFVGPLVSALYARARPRFHSIVIERLTELLRIETPLGRALDVGCGTGLSSVALTAIARSVYGLDVSADMLRHAEQHARIRLLAARAEAQPFAASSVDLLCVSSVMHWLDEVAFVGEARRVLGEGGFLVIYDNGFTGRI